jgi:mono/diheme cytochrome c family protein
MNFPIYQVPYLGNGMLIALDAVLHVIISHGLAIGAIALAVLSEYIGMKKSSEEWERFAREFLRFTVIITTGVGATTGVGIWFITSALSPRAIGSMLRVFFWPWFIEWIVFTLEVITVLIYYFTWDRWKAARKSQHIFVGLGYVVFACVSAFLISGILGFMLTPDGWPWDKRLTSALFNLTLLPQFLLRLAISFALGSVFAAAYVLLTKRSVDFRGQALRFFGGVSFVSVCALSINGWWYFRTVPSPFISFSRFSVLTSRFSMTPELLYVVNAIGALVLSLFVFFAFRRSALAARLLVVPALVVSFGFVAEFERIREFIRGPYLMPGYLYANQVLITERTLFEKEGMLTHTPWYKAVAAPGDDITKGALLFAQNCSACHTIGGINDIRERLKGRTEDGIFVILPHTNRMVPYMPPFAGTDEERRTTARFLYQVAQRQIALRAPSRYVPMSGRAGHE